MAWTSNFPGSLDSISRKVAGNDIIVDDINGAYDCIEHLEAKVGTTTPSAGSLAYILTDASSVDPGHKHTSATTFTVSSTLYAQSLLKTDGGVHVGGSSDPGSDNLIVDGTTTLTGAVNVSAAGSIGETTVCTIRGLNKEIVKTTDTALTALEVSGTLINNYGQGATNVTLTLPTIAAGMSFMVILGTTQGSYFFKIKAAAGDKIYLNGVAGTDGYSVRVAAATAGNSASFFAFQTGSGAYDWFCSTSYGTWEAVA